MDYCEKSIDVFKANAYIQALYEKAVVNEWECDTSYYISSISFKPFISTTFQKWTFLKDTDYKVIEISLYRNFIIVEYTRKINGIRKYSKWHYDIKP